MEIQLIHLCIDIILFTLIYREIKKPVKKKSAKKTSRKKIHAEAKNNVSVLNAPSDYQKFETAKVVVPVIAEDVLTYQPGELGAAYPGVTNLFYPKEAISDPDYLETILTSPLQMKTHEKNTTDANIDVNGWATRAWWDDTEKKVFADGVVIGKENVEYAKQNKDLPGFGTSAYISFLRVDKENGTAPNGKPYNAIVRKAINNHIAILPNIRDPKNKIVALNAIVAKNAIETIDVSNPSWVADDSTWERAKKAASEENYDDYYAVVTDIYKKMGGEIKHGENAMPIDKEEFRKAMNEYEKEKSEKDEAINKAVKNELEKKEAENKAKNEEKEPEKKEPEKEAGNGEDKEGDDEAMNALPSDDMLKDFTRYLSVTFPKTPSLRTLASLVGVTGNSPAEIISALNAKRESFKSGAMNQEKKSGSLNDLLREI